MQVMADTIYTPSDLAELIKARRKAAGLSKTALARQAGKVREVIYRLEAGEDVTVSSLLAVLAALGLALHTEPAGLPSPQEMAARFARDED